MVSAITALWLIRGVPGFLGSNARRREKRNEMRLEKQYGGRTPMSCTGGHLLATRMWTWLICEDSSGYAGGSMPTPIATNQSCTLVDIAA
jgi:hypothetical protein